MFAVLCSVLISSAFAAVTTHSPDVTTAISPVSLFFTGYDTNPKDGVISNPEFHKAAYTYDTDGDRTITKLEFVTLYSTRLGVSEHQAEVTFNAIDINQDGTFDDKEISAIYNVFDGNGDGQMTPEEFLAGFTRFSTGHSASG
ncbi:hypothetical protein CHS0354_021962 [Potamilus streckersoni]|uniref:EF-hand domain-containing protein n=1 Tax=Potamilus streckersoni TaxID=2493646 RepID=A0AAE0SKI0_9BIVA|nr:hypothetical protein CHS0354_021962 [Potamilus streckersoni]